LKQAIWKENIQNNCQINLNSSLGLWEHQSTNLQDTQLLS